MARFTPLDHVVDPNCEAPAGRHGFFAAHRFDKCTCPCPSFDSYRASREKENKRRSATRTSRSEYKTNPRCEARRHGSLRAVKDLGCVCPGPGMDAYKAAREREAAARAAIRASAREVKATGKPKPLTPKQPGDMIRWPMITQPAKSAERQLRERDDLACDGAPLDVFFPTGTGGFAEAQITEARAICRRCPATRLCLQAGLERGDQWAVLAGTTPKERAQLRRVTEADTSRHDDGDPNVVSAYHADRVAWGRLTDPDRRLLVTELKRRGHSCSSVANNVGASYQAVRTYWEKVDTAKAAA